MIEGVYRIAYNPSVRWLLRSSLHPAHPRICFSWNCWIWRVKARHDEAAGRRRGWGVVLPRIILPGAAEDRSVAVKEGWC